MNGLGTPTSVSPGGSREAAAAVELRGVAKRFGGTVAVEDVSLQIGRGEFLTLLGPSGCGKTTTLRLIAGFERPSAGDILIEGRAVQALPAHKRPVNTVFQSYALFPHMSVGDNVAFGLRMARVAPAERRRRVAEALELVRLGGLERRRPGQLSGGQQQRVALARALVNRPSVLLLDEPLGALDLKLRRAMQGELRAINREVGITFVYVTHDQEEALAMSDRIAVMSGGRVLQVGPAEEIYERPTGRFVADFVGEANLLPGRLARVADGLAEVALASGGLVCARAPSGTIAAGREVSVAVRPERVAVAAATAGTREDAAGVTGTREDAAGVTGTREDAAGVAGTLVDAAGVAGTLVETLYLGSMLQHVVAVAGGGRVTARMPRVPGAPVDAALTPGAAVVLSWPPAQAVVLID